MHSIFSTHGARIIAGIGERFKEFNLLAVLVRNAGRVVPRNELVAEAWGEEYISATDSLKLYIHYLRQKLEGNPQQPEYILTSRGVGYRFVNR